MAIIEPSIKSNFERNMISVNNVKTFENNIDMEKLIKEKEEHLNEKTKKIEDLIKENEDLRKENKELKVELKDIKKKGGE